MKYIYIYIYTYINIYEYVPDIDQAARSLNLSTVSSFVGSSFQLATCFSFRFICFLASDIV